MELEITLKSDLCAGAGKHYSSIIDLDTSLDEYGLPYIPAKRLKGCLKEVASLIFNQDRIDEIFGVAGSDKSAPFSISDAKLEDYDVYVNDIIKNKIDDSDVNDLFCSVRSETSIDEETKTAKDKTLRFVRVVNQHSPIDKSNLVFVSDVSADKEFEEDLMKIAKALRNIGYHRNRGLGAVKCRMNTESKNDCDFESYSLEDDCVYKLDYTIRNDSDIMLPNNSADCTMDYIPGTSVFGAFAGLYCKYKYDINKFNDFFYSDDVRFSNLYIMDKNFEKCYPSIRFMAKRKDISGIFNTINGDEKVSFKPLKKGYLNKDNSYIEPISKRVYHNAVNSVDSSLYMQHCLCAGQYFGGTIIAKGNKMEVLYELLKKDQLRFGKSKTAQYSNCSVIADSVKIQKLSNDETVLLKKGTFAAYVLRSDAVIVDENGREQTSISALQKALGLENKKLYSKSNIALTTISGYNAKWNLKKPHINAFKAGSAIVFEITEDTELKKTQFIGEKQNEGFGVVELIPNVDKLEEKVIDFDDIKPDYIKCEKTPISDAIRKEKVNEAIKELALEKISTVKLNSTQIGRLILMCKEAENMDNLLKRINSIKTKSVKDNATKIYNTVKEEQKEHWKEYLITLLTLAKYQKKIDKRRMSNYEKNIL